MSTKKFLLQEKDIPTAWYNIVADMKTKPLPPLNPQTHEPMKEEDFYPLFAKERVASGNESDRCVDRNTRTGTRHVQNMASYPVGACLWIGKYLTTPAHIYFKNESVSPVGIP